MGKLSNALGKTESPDCAMGENSEKKTLTPIKAIRAHCLWCCCGSSQEVKLCPSTDCELYPYREGHNPNIKPREYTEEQRQAMRDRIANLKRGE